jgi:protein-tyrosine kinase
MDRIHSAIAKARASREAVDPIRQAVQVTPAQQLKGTANWADLPEFQISVQTFDTNHIVAHRSDPAATAFDMMRSALLHNLHTHGWTRVAVTSPDAGCGKTTVTLNLAFSLARMMDMRVMVVELDFRRPGMFRALGLDRSLRFSEVLTETQPPEAQLIRCGTNLVFGLSSTPVQSPAELLSSVRAADVVDRIEAAYRPDVILFDMPPMSAGDDTLAFLDQVDCALMVAAAEQTSTSMIDQCGKDLAKRTQVLGVVLNKCRMVDPNDMYG